MTDTLGSTDSVMDRDRMFKRVKRHEDVVVEDTAAAAATTTETETGKKKKVIGTHSGSFQADEAMGCWMITQLPEYYNNYTIVRTRDEEYLSFQSNNCDIVLDVGGIYDHNTLRYDHHQRGYNERFDDDNDNDNDGRTRCTMLSASGLIYRHYGKCVIQQFYPNLSSEYLQLAYVKLYNTLLEALDAIDTGVEMVPAGTTVLYKDSTGLSSRVSRLNPRWNENIDDRTGLPPNYDDRFMEAVQICGHDFLSVLTDIVESYIPARAYVEDAFQERYNVCPTGQILCFRSGGLPWQSHLYDIEKKHNLHSIENQILFVLYTDQAKMWRVQAVTVETAKFTNRCSLVQEWCGLRDTALVNVCGIPGARFVHAAGFIGGSDTYEGALAMAQITIQQQQPNK